MSLVFSSFSLLIISYIKSFNKDEIPYTVLWHPVLNQLMIGMKDGTIKMLYDPLISIRGACLVEGRTVLILIIAIDTIECKEEGNDIW